MVSVRTTIRVDGAAPGIGPMPSATASPESGKSTSTREGCNDSISGSASGTEHDSWTAANEEPENIRRSPSRKRRLASIKSTELLVMGPPPQRCVIGAIALRPLALNRVDEPRLIAGFLLLNSKCLSCHNFDISQI